MFQLLEILPTHETSNTTANIDSDICMFNYSIYNIVMDNTKLVRMSESVRQSSGRWATRVNSVGLFVYTVYIQIVFLITACLYIYIYI